MSIFLTGATGFVGAAVLSRLREQDLPVVALVRDPAKQAVVEATGASVILGNLTDLDLIASAVAAASGVIHPLPRAMRRARPWTARSSTPCWAS